VGGNSYSNTALIESNRSFAPTLAKAKRAFRLLVEQTIIPIKFYFFVDGLDEYDGDHENMLNCANQWLSCPMLRLAYPAPLLVFEDAFKGAPSLRLQDSTFQDIQLYTSEKLWTNSKFQKLAI
jgi:hypothetical protein